MTNLDFIHAVNKEALRCIRGSVIDYSWWQDIHRSMETDTSDYFGPSGYWHRQRWIRNILCE